MPVLLASARCPRVQLLHVACPGCGMSRAFARLAHGELRESLTMHPLAVPMLLAQVALAAVTVMVTLERGSPLELCKVRYGCTSLLALAVAAAFVVLLWIVKMMGFAGGPVLV